MDALRLECDVSTSENPMGDPLRVWPFLLAQERKGPPHPSPIPRELRGRERPETDMILTAAF